MTNIERFLPVLGPYDARSCPMDEVRSAQPSELVEVFRKGEIIKEWTLDEAVNWRE